MPKKSQVIYYGAISAVILTLAGLQFARALPMSGQMYTFLFTGVLAAVFALGSVVMGTYGLSLVVLALTLLSLLDSPDSYLGSLEQVVIIFAFGVLMFLIYSLRQNRLDYYRKRRDHYYQLSTNSIHPLILKNRKGEVQYASESIKDVLGIDCQDLMGTKISPHLHPDDLDEYFAFTKRVLRRPNTLTSIEVRFKRPDGEWIWVRNDAKNMLADKDIQAVVTSFQDITKRKLLDAQLIEHLKQAREAQRIAEKAVKDRDEFLSIASHELKTPLTTILLQLQTTLRRILTQSLADFSGDKLVRSLQIAEQQSQRLSVLIKDLLNVSLVSTGKIELDREEVDLSETVESLVERFEEEIKLAETEVELKLNGPVQGEWDTVRVEQAITNLLTNALKYGEKKPVQIQVERIDGQAVISVKDNGVGISQEGIEKIYEPFTRADDQSQGLGVGLFITKRIVEAHGGEIRTSSVKGKGSIFSIHLPMEDAPDTEN